MIQIVIECDEETNSELMQVIAEYCFKNDPEYIQIKGGTLNYTTVFKQKDREEVS